MVHIGHDIGDSTIGGNNKGLGYIYMYIYIYIYIQATDGPYRARHRGV
jgi:hypothetical protein